MSDSAEDHTLQRWRNAIMWAVRDASVENLCWMIEREPMPPEVCKDIAGLVALGAINGIPGNKAKRKKVEAGLSDEFIEFAYMVEHQLNGLDREIALAKIAEQRDIAISTAEDKLKRARKRSGSLRTVRTLNKSK